MHIDHLAKQAQPRIRGEVTGWMCGVNEAHADNKKKIPIQA